MRKLLLSLLLLIPLTAQAGLLSNAPASAVGVDSATLNAAISASAAQTAAMIPPACSSVPTTDTLNGAIGTGTSCFTKATDSRPSTVQKVNTTTASDGTWSVTFNRSFVSSTPVVNPLPVNIAGTQPYICNVTTRSQTAATGKCWQTVTTTLPALASSLLGLVINPTGTVGAGTTVMIVAGEPTQ